MKRKIAYVVGVIAVVLGVVFATQATAAVLASDNVTSGKVTSDYGDRGYAGWIQVDLTAAQKAELGNHPIVAVSIGLIDPSTGARAASSYNLKIADADTFYVRVRDQWAKVLGGGRHLPPDGAVSAPITPYTPDVVVTFQATSKYVV